MSSENNVGDECDSPGAGETDRLDAAVPTKFKVVVVGTSVVGFVIEALEAYVAAHGRDISSRKIIDQMKSLPSSIKSVIFTGMTEP